MKMRNKGKIYPSSPSPSSPTTFPTTNDTLSVLNLLPAAILTLTVVLSLEDREVLAYMITRSIKTSNPNNNNNTTTTTNNNKKTSNPHKPPVFDCDCFDCYTSYWFKWDTSANRELIHQAIEAFEENLNKNEHTQKKKKKKMGHRKFAGKPILSPEVNNIIIQDSKTSYEVALVEGEVEVEGGGCVENNNNEGGNILSVSDKLSENLLSEDLLSEELLSEKLSEDLLSETAVGKGVTARKVLPDVVGLFNWRSWGFWSPNV